MMRTKLLQDKELLQKQLSWIQISFDECKAIGIQKSYGIDEFGNQGTLIDVVNNAHKRGLFDDMEELRIMKDIRNTIAHEYIEDELVEIFEEVLKYTEKLIVIIQTTLKYIEESI